MPRHHRQRHTGGLTRYAHRPGVDYTKVRSPALAIYAETFFDVYGNLGARPNSRRTPRLGAEIHGAIPGCIHRSESKRELPSVEILEVPGTHNGDSVFTSREQVVSAMQRFFGGTEEKASEGQGFAKTLATLVLAVGRLPDKRRKKWF